MSTPMSTTNSIAETLKSSLSATNIEVSKVGYEAYVSSDSDSSEQGSCNMSLDSEYLDACNNRKNPILFPVPTSVSNAAKTILDRNEQNSEEKSAVWVAKLHKDMPFDNKLVDSKSASDESVGDGLVGDESADDQLVDDELVTNSEIEVDQLVSIKRGSKALSSGDSLSLGASGFDAIMTYLSELSQNS
ncbi:hypothetical protein FRC12_001488 [Ceratobasidium sp. 428]|nr:hypothetical protein FRC12_001488 [Ceratobasidium sp. 428]